VPALLVVGLGNPGPRFDGTRHNVGFAVVEAVAERLQLRFRKPLFARYRATRIERRSDGLALAEPLTYMNNSGQVFPSLLRRYRVTSEGLLVVCDNLDLPPGRVRLKRGGGSAGHNGLSSIVKALGHGEFMRLYIGVGRPESGGVVEHVLGQPPENERTLYDEAISRSVDAVISLREQSLDQVMNEINRRQA
jgi:PTH1 family peptidyl-tRNA hydrolase